jgi:hypothetical protein
MPAPAAGFMSLLAIRIVFWRGTGEDCDPYRKWSGDVALVERAGKRPDDREVRIDGRSEGVKAIHQHLRLKIVRKYL